jgi:hypothetical protein
MNACNSVPTTVTASLDARLAPFNLATRDAPAGRGDGEGPLPGQPEATHPRSHGFVKDLKLLFAALGAGGSVVPLGDNRRAATLLAHYAACLRDH